MTQVFQFECSPRVACGHRFFWECGDPYEEDPSCPNCGEEVCVFVVPGGSEPMLTNPKPVEMTEGFHVRHCKIVCGLCTDDTRDCPGCKDIERHVAMWAAERVRV